MVLQGFFGCGFVGRREAVRRVQLSGVDLQRQTLRLYGELVARSESWAGKLVFACGQGVLATGLPAAVSIAGGTSLVLDPNTAAVKSVFRQGGVDFVVNTLDEALRVLKNEIRKHRPLSVALEGEVQPALAEMRDRGVLPDLQVSIGDAESGGEELGIERLRLTSEGGVVAPSALLQEWLAERGWSEIVLERAMTAELRELDARLLALLPEGEAQRRTWVQRIAHYQRPEPGGARVVWLTEAERVAVESSAAVV
jgi:urocanate hydratase